MRLNLIGPPLARVCAVVLFVFFSSAAFAQVKVGIKAGAQASFTPQQDMHTYGKAGYLGGIAAKFELSEAFALNLEALFSQHNTLMNRYNDLTSATSYWDPFVISYKTSTNKFYSFNLPVTAQYALHSSETFSAGIYLGPYATYNLKVIEHYIKTGMEDGNLHTATVRGSEDVSSEFRNWVYGATAGVKAEVAMGENALVFDIRYNYDITPYKKHFSYSGIPGTGQDLQMQMLSITAGYLFQL
jgi:hypothetical protein